MWRFTEIIGAHVFHDGAFHKESVYIAVDRFVSQREFFVESQTAIIEMVDGHNKYFVPGLTDCFVRGHGQISFTSADTQAVHDALRAVAKEGTTQLLAVTTSSLTTLAHVHQRGGVNNGALLAGIHFERNEPQPNDQRECLANAYNIPADSIKAISYAADTVHGTGIHHVSHRSDGLLQWQNESEQEYAPEGTSFVLDLADPHVSSETINQAFKRAPERIALTMAALSSVDFPDIPTMPLLDGLKLVVAAGVPLESALYAASEYPAQLIGIDKKAGLVKMGLRANGLLLDRDLNLEQVFLNGYPLLA